MTNPGEAAAASRDRFAAAAARLAQLSRDGVSGRALDRAIAGELLGLIEGLDEAMTTPFEQYQAEQLATLLDAVGDTPLSDAERDTLRWLAGWERRDIGNIAAVIRRARGEH